MAGGRKTKGGEWVDIGKDKGFIVLHRSLLDWEWYTDVNTSRLFIHLLLTVNHMPKQWKGVTVERGQRVASYSKLAAETGMTVKQIRTALEHLKRTGEVAHKANSKFGLFAVKNYDKYQSHGTQNGSQMAVKGQSVGSQGAVKGQRLNNATMKQCNNETRENERGVSGESAPLRARFVPPDESSLIAFFREQGSDKAEAEAFRDYYEANGWKVGKNSMKNWKAAARGWIRRAGQYGHTAKNSGQPKPARDVLDKAIERIENGDLSVFGGITP